MLSIADGNRTKRKIVCIGAHPDDVELGMAGTVAKHSNRGDEVLIIICTLGIGGKSGDPRIREKEAQDAAQILGARLLIIDYPVVKLNRPSVEFAEILRQKIQEIMPDRVYTHSPHDYHQVHEAVSQCSLQAASDVPQILFYEEASSTSPEFLPNAYVDITDYIHLKIQCLKSHNTQAEKLYVQENIARSLAHSRYVLGKIGTRPGGMAEAFAIARFTVVNTQPIKKTIASQGIGGNNSSSESSPVRGEINPLQQRQQNPIAE